jgi:glycosyltransferase involved in cell wall biosynthesis
MKIRLLVEGWRSSSHSYALVNQQQLRHLADDPRFSLSHADVKPLLPEWASVPSGLPQAVTACVAAIPSALIGAAADVTYRINFPYRAVAGSGRTLVFATGEYTVAAREHLVGMDGKPESARLDEIEIVTPSERSREAFVAVGFRRERVHVVPHGFDPALLLRPGSVERIRVRERLQVPRTAFLFLNVGGMSWNKGVGILIAAFSVHVRRFPESILVLKANEALYGSRMQETLADAIRLQPAVRDLDTNAALRYVPQNIPFDELCSLYRACDAYVSPYRAEAFNLPVLEAMPAGLPVIHTAGGPTAEFCPAPLSSMVGADRMALPSGMGYLEPRLEALVEAMDAMAGDAGRRQRMSESATAHAARSYTWKDVTRRLAELLAG